MISFQLWMAYGFPVPPEASFRRWSINGSASAIADAGSLCPSGKKSGVMCSYH